MKKSIAFLLCVLLLALVLTACGNDTNTDKNATDNQDNGIVDDVGDGAKDVIDGAAEGADDVIDGVQDALDPDNNENQKNDDNTENKNSSDNNQDNKNQNAEGKNQNENTGTTEASMDGKSADQDAA